MPQTGFTNPVICALDTPDAGQARALGRAVAPSVGGLKLGLEFFAAQGPTGAAAVGALGLPLFLDLKLHDIPNTVAGTVRALLPLEPALLTLHAGGGPAMLEAARKAAEEAGTARPRLIAVTVLTSLDAGDLAAFGIARAPADQVLALARIARDSGVDGIVCSPQEVAAVRAEFGPDLLVVTPGVRPAGARMDDQKRAMTPVAALAAGADLLVIGRPITAADDPAEAARRIAQSLAGA